MSIFSKLIIAADGKKSIIRDITNTKLYYKEYREKAIVVNFAGGPIGLDTLAAFINEESETIMEVYEPYLLQIGLLSRTPKGRIATKLAYDLFGREYTLGKQGNLI